MTRVQIELSNGEVKDLDAVINMPPSRDRQEAVANAIKLLEWAVRERETGNAPNDKEQTTRYRQALDTLYVAIETPSKQDTEKGVEIPIKRKK